MVVFSASIVSNRKILLSRQFVEMTRGDVETYLNRFIKKIEQFCLSNEYTYMEIDNIRFIYQAIDNIYLILMTPINSNIIEDMDTLQLFCQVLYDCCNNPPPITEDLIANNCFEVIFAFDEIISFGYKESINLSQIKTCLEMESQEEKLHKLIRQNKENEEKERRRHIANRLDKERTTNEAFNQSSYKSANSNNNIVKSSLSGIAAFAESVGVGKIAQSVGIGPVKNISRNDSNAVNNSDPASNNRTFGMHKNESNTIQSINAPGKGMFIGKKKPITEPKQNVGSSTKATDTHFSDFKSKENVNNTLDKFIEDECSLIEEKIEFSLNIDGTIQSKIEIQGTFQVTLSSEAFPEYSITEDPRFQFKTHPNLNKEKFQDCGKLVLKDGINCALPVNTLMPLVKWRLSSHFQNHQIELPFSFSCWPLDTGSGYTNVTIEIESSQSITDFKLNFPLISVSTHSANLGVFELNKNSYSWDIPQLSPSETAVLELSTDQSNFLPINLCATTSRSVCKIGIIKGKNYVNPKRCVAKYNIAINQ
ncbi:coatomer complex delta chain [Cryptosporidium sp. chipmunk genotype I]|uniref:coatomer complex delta chain n=1 Tax=Cryptosporidium sp. chipmunk genotype I TaxID=1280935 RepID=UPI003519E6F1|nr:coatomer complex delta chain [Cryptosporidium sp. chipmunk genotype I]